MTEPITDHDVDWSTISTAQIAATLKALVPLVSPNRNMELIAEAAARLDGFAAQLAEARDKALEEAARELAMRLVLNVENWPAEYFRGFDDARSVVAALKGSQ